MLHALPFTTFGEIAAVGLKVHVYCTRCHSWRRLDLQDGRVSHLDPKYARLRRCWVRRHPRDCIKGRHQRIDLGCSGRLLRDDDGIAL
jgi:hypothetical protein